MLGGLVTSKNTSLGMVLSITSRLERECLGGCGSLVRALAAKLSFSNVRLAR